MMLGMVTFLWVAASTMGEERPAHVQSQYSGQLVTSTTLGWIRGGAGLATPPEAVSSGTGKGVVCRGQRHGTLLTGATSQGRCEVGISGRLVNLASYEVLTQVVGASKLEWRSYTRFSPVPPGAVAGVEGEEPVFVARRLEETKMVSAALELPKPGGGFGSIKVYSKYREVRLENDCDLMVEVEPVSYELEVEIFKQKAKRKVERKVLASTSMFRFGEGKEKQARLQKIVYYSYEKSVYFGQMHGTIRGLPGRVKLPSGERKAVMWGMSDSAKQRESIMVTKEMEKNSAVDVEVVANLVKEEQPFTARLFSVFPDGSRRERKIEGVMQTKSLTDIKAEYSVLYQIRDQLVSEKTTTVSPWHNSLTGERDLWQQSPTMGNSITMEGVAVGSQLSLAAVQASSALPSLPCHALFFLSLIALVIQ